MMDRSEKAHTFKALHVKGTPLVLYNAWDAGSARAVADAGAPAIATGSWSVAAAQGFADGEALPMADALRAAAQIVSAVDLPVSVDFEGGYAVAAAEVGQNVARLIETGAIGLNFEDRIVGAKGLHSIEVQAARISAIRAAAEAKGAAFFINARTDVFFQGSKEAPEVLMAEALARAAAYKDAGADGLFVPGVNDPDRIAHICAAQDLPVNVMRVGQEIAALAACGVARISHGPAPYIKAMKALTAAATAL